MKFRNQNGYTSKPARLLFQAFLSPTSLLGAILLFSPCSQDRLYAQTSQTPSAFFSSAKRNFSKTDPKSVTLTGTASMYAGRTTEQGNITLFTDDKGAYTFEFTSSSEVITESANGMDSKRLCTWSRGGQQHNAESSNCWMSTAWFFPHLFFTEAYSTRTAATDMGLDNQGRHNLQIAASTESLNAPSAVKSSIQKWSTTHVFMDQTTQLPAELDYVIYPAGISNKGAATKVLFGNYHVVNGVQIPQHITRYVNGTLQWDINITSVSVQF